MLGNKYLRHPNNRTPWPVGRLRPRPGAGISRVDLAKSLQGQARAVGSYQTSSIEFDLFELDNAFVNKCAEPAR